MSDVLAIAAVTQVLTHLIGEALRSGSAAATLGTEPAVTALSPDQVLPAGDAAPGPLVNVHLHCVTPIAALKNQNLPALDHPGQPVPPTGLSQNLHYLVTAVAGQALHAEVLLGHVLGMLHVQPVVARDTVRAALEKAADQNALAVSIDPGLADRMHPLEITQRPLPAGDLSGIWNAFRAGYRTTVACDVRLILNEG